MKLRHIALTVACAMLAACSQQDRPSIIGHWQAERATMFSAHLPIGPDIVISEQGVGVPGTDAQIPLHRISRKGDETILELPYGVGVSLWFDGPDRMHVEMPVIGKVYYRRVHDAVAMQPAPPQSAVVQGTVPVVAARPQRPARSPEFDQAVLAANRGDQDGAIDHLNAAFRQGFRSFDTLETAPEFASLRTDVRYQALLAHYR